MFVDRITLARVGDTIVVKNSAPVPTTSSGRSGNNGEFNATVPKLDAVQDAERLVRKGRPIQYKCTIHGVDDRLRSHLRPPVLRRDRRRREVRDQERPGREVPDRVLAGERLPGGAQGRFGDPIEIKAPVTEVKTEYDVSPKKN